MGSVRRRGDRARVTLDQAEAGLLVSLASQVSALLTEGSDPIGDVAADADPIELLEASLGGVPRSPDDPILLRLLPDAYRDDPAATGEFRRLTDGDLRATKRAALDRIRQDLGEADPQGRTRTIVIDLDEAAATLWLHALTDVRLALGVRLDVTEDTDARLAESHDRATDSERAAELAVYDWLTWLQDALVRAVSR